ncbi:2-acyl-glycerophospho-ethanolamine acyltransferase [Pseudoruegeria aquimaris]|uniref:2-acyl-glycerophospho-ethanolamine acyltransferase n=1 Tax=Pseudoruegeria aquimaris TaxID=393663 RepID=A0A1Y5RL47_9RHOB|nr:lysophospholipid acyltransferase family protein [Pseudoruegeria aquimaris]SLN18889.1 2-acyl-glycerophospho-ethanolamine acyltransferase [Pseudoruegeria aquimaris]
MNVTWNSEDRPQAGAPLAWQDWLRVAWRGLALAALTFGGLLILLLLRLIERPLYGVERPITPYVTQFVCRNAFRILGMGYATVGAQMRQKGAVVANHASWLDIFTLNARNRVYFVSKSEVAGWPGIGWLARATGTVFITRDPRQARAQKEIFEARLKAGHKLLFFPEGTSTDGRQVLPFKPTLFEAFFADGLREILWVQPVSVVYHAPEGEDARFYGWWGDMDFATHLLKTLAARRQGSVEVIYHAPVKVSHFPGRKALARHCEAAVRQGFNDYLA